MMFGPRLTTVFASRWKALAWAASILLTAYCSVPSASEGDGAEGNQAAVRLVTGLLGNGRPDTQPSRSPWAPDQPAPAH